jgi:hypothetical protein
MGFHGKDRVPLYVLSLPTHWVGIPLTNPDGNQTVQKTPKALLCTGQSAKAPAQSSMKGEMN